MRQCSISEFGEFANNTAFQLISTASTAPVIATPTPASTAPASIANRFGTSPSPSPLPLSGSDLKQRRTASVDSKSSTSSGGGGSTSGGSTTSTSAGSGSVVFIGKDMADSREWITAIKQAISEHVPPPPTGSPLRTVPTRTLSTAKLQ